MAQLHDVVVYLCSRYPHKQELSKARLTKMVYLADWRSAITRGQQLTDITWVFNHYGPYVEDVTELARTDGDFTIVRETNQYGSDKDVIHVRHGATYASLTDADREILDFVIKKTAPMYWDGFIRLVYSTYPILMEPRFSELDLVALAQRYEADQRAAAESVTT